MSSSVSGYPSNVMARMQNSDTGTKAIDFCEDGRTRFHDTGLGSKYDEHGVQLTEEQFLRFLALAQEKGCEDSEMVRPILAVFPNTENKVEDVFFQKAFISNEFSSAHLDRKYEIVYLSSEKDDWKI
jgi:hypothetical protein